VTEALGTFESASVSNEEKSLELEDVFPNAFEQKNPTNQLSGIIEDDPFQSTTSSRSNSPQKDDTEKLRSSLRAAMRLDPFADDHDSFLSHSENDVTDHDLEELPAPVAVEPRILKLNDDSSTPSHVALAKQIQALQEKQKESEEALKRELGEKDMMIATLAKHVEELSAHQRSIDMGSTKKKEKSKKKRSPKRFQGQTAARVGMLGEVYDISLKASPSIRRKTLPLVTEELKTKTGLADLFGDSNEEAPQRRRSDARANAKTAIPRRHGSTGAIKMRSRLFSKIDANNGAIASNTVIPDLSADSDDEAARRREARAKAKKANPKRHGSTGAINSRNRQPSKREANPGRIAAMFSHLMPPKLKRQGSDSELRREARAKAKKGNPKMHGSTGAISKRTSRKSKTSSMLGNPHADFGDLNLDDLQTPSERKISQNRRSSEKVKSKKPERRTSQEPLSIDGLVKAVTKGRRNSRRSLDVKDDGRPTSTPSTPTEAVTKGRRKSERSLDANDDGNSPSTPSTPTTLDSKQMRRGSKKNNLVSKLKNSLSPRKDKRKLFVLPMES
jgi:ribosomal protein L21E